MTGASIAGGGYGGHQEAVSIKHIRCAVQDNSSPVREGGGKYPNGEEVTGLVRTFPRSEWYWSQGETAPSRKKKDVSRSGLIGEKP